MKRILMFLVVVVLIVLGGCDKEAVEAREAYEKCTSVCASVLSEDYVTLHLCNEECKNEFLNVS